MGKFTPHPDKTDTRTAGRVRTAIWFEETAAERMLDNLSFGKGDVWGVIALDHPLHQDGEDPDKPEHAVCIAITGNGPASEANANHLARVWNADEEITNLRTQLERAEGEMEKWRGSSQESYQLLWGVFHHFTVQGNGVQGPGHLHTVRGVWDHTGEECEWCAEWEKIKNFFHGEPIVEQTQERIDRFNQNLLFSRDTKYLWHILRRAFNTILKRGWLALTGQEG